MLGIIIALFLEGFVTMAILTPVLVVVGVMLLIALLSHDPDDA